MELIHCGIGLNKKGLKNRIRQIYHPTLTQSTNQNIKKRIKNIYSDFRMKPVRNVSFYH